MKYLNNPTELNKEFKRLINAYDNYYWMIAWAGNPFDKTFSLLDNTEKIRKIIVGLHFYQTHPDFIDAFHPHECVKYNKSTSGVFHPKVYLFSNDEETWELIIGSSNFTDSGFNKNNEANILIQSADGHKEIYRKVKDSIDSAWNIAKKFTDSERIDYRRYWYTQQEKIRKLERYQNQNSAKPYYQIPVVKMSWREYVDKIYLLNEAAVMERIKVLDLAQDYFHYYPIFSQMPELERKRIGGYIWSNQPADFRLFGNMLNATEFTNQINNDPVAISNALDEIPLIADVTRQHYYSFVEKFEAALNGGNKYRSATRLLAMKRPDIFFCLSNGNNELFADDFDIKGITTINLKRYWDEVIERIFEADWWQNPQPQNEIEQRIEKYKAAFMDAMYYDPSLD